jgi:hypothetical protein
MFYADDSQTKVQPEAQVVSLERCLMADIKTWTIENKLILNDSKTGFLHLHSNFVKEPCIISI